MSQEKVLAQTVQLIHGVDMLGSRTSLVAKKGNELEVTPLGIKATSGGSGRVVLIPWTNIRGCDVSTGPVLSKAQVQAKRAAKPKPQVTV